MSAIDAWRVTERELIVQRLTLHNLGDDIWEVADKLLAAYDELEDEFITLNTRGCGGCEYADKNGEPWGCRANMLLFPKPTECCNHWAERSAK